VLGDLADKDTTTSSRGKMVRPAPGEKTIGPCIMSLMERPSNEELASIRAVLESTKFDAVSDSIREIVEQFLPHLKKQLPPKHRGPKAGWSEGQNTFDSRTPIPRSGTKILSYWSMTVRGIVCLEKPF
jgi:hypothetical protein